MSLNFFFFFFSSRRRHTRCSRDWSSDVCSSDLFVDQELLTLEVNDDGRGLSPSLLESLRKGTGDLRVSIAGMRELMKRSEEHTSELQSRLHLVCRLLLEKKNK